MISNNGHIISRCRWETSFDKKELGAALQGRLSSWSRLKMPAEIEAVFDKMCPTAQVWKIQSLEIDLGLISFNDLEPELTLKLRKQLSKKIADLIIHRNDSEGIEIIGEDTLHMELISYFLLYGLIHRNYKNSGSSIDEVLTLQLRNNRRQVIVMLRDIGATHENVRKRIASQISEANIIKIIEGLEPNYARQVIDLSTELTAIQAKESVVQTGAADFKKQVWFWTLNYLLAERGSVFNKVAFMKSNISQMAQHYHMGYDELIEMIGRAVDKVTKHSIIKTDLILTFSILVKENRAAGIKKEKVRTADAYKTLENYFAGQTTPGRGYSKAELNDLILSIADRDEAALRKLLLSFSERETFLQGRVAELNEGSLGAIFSALIANDPVISSKDIYFLGALCAELKLNVEPGFLWEAGIQFALGKQGVSFTRKEFLDYLVTELSKKSQAGKATILEQLICADIPPGIKALSSLEIYTSLITVFVAEITKHDSVITTRRVNELLDGLNLHVSANGTGGALFVALQKPLIQYIRLNPDVAFKALVDYRDKQAFQQLLPHLLDERLTNILACNAKTEITEVLLSLEQDLAGYKFNKADTQIVALVKRTLAYTALEAMLCEPGLNTEEYLELIPEKIVPSIPVSGLAEFSELLDKWHTDSKISGKTVIAAFINSIKQTLSAMQKLSVAEQAAWLMRKNNNQSGVSKLLLANFREKRFVKIRNSGNKESAAILNYLLKDGANLMAALVREYVPLLNNSGVKMSPDKIVQLLNELYWKCILEHAYHGGNAAALRKLFEAAVWTGFNIFPGNNIDRTADIKLTGQKITLNELFSLITQAITLGQNSVMVNGRECHLTELIITALEINPAELARVIKKIAITEKRLKVLSTAIYFDQFCLLIANGTGGNMHDAIAAVQVLFELANRVSSGDITEKLLYAFWRSVWKIIRTGNLKSEELKNLVADSFYQLATKKHVDSDFIISEIKKLPVQLTPLLKKALAGYNPAFGVLPVQETHSLSQQLSAIKQKGLLYDLSYHIVTRGHVPLWFFIADDKKTTDILNEIVAHHPVNLVLVLKHEAVSERQMAWLHQHINFKILINSIARLTNGRQLILNDMEQLYKAFDSGAIGGVPVKELQYSLFRKLISAWVANNWVAISGENIWSELIWDITANKGATQKQIMDDAEKIMPYLPPSLQIGFSNLKEQNKNTAGIRPLASKISKPISQMIQRSPGKEGIIVKNAGLVLVNNYVPVLLERLGLVQNKVFISSEAKARAVHYLQYVVTGLSSTDEHLLPLNKVMCGLPLAFPVENGIGIGEEHATIIEGLINAMIGHWPSIGDNSVYGFRGNWLVRDGLLTELEDKWELTVEKRAYDILLSKSPFSFSIIKYPWMNKPLHVNWTY